MVTTWTRLSANEIEAADPGRDSAFSFVPGQWVELSDDARELAGSPGVMVRITNVSNRRLTLDPGSAVPGPLNLADFLKEPMPKVRRWDGAEGLRAVKSNPAVNDGFLALEDGIEVKFSAGTYRTGDYWLIPARTAASDIEWPKAESRPPHGITHHYCKLAVVSFDDHRNVVGKPGDCRALSPPMTELTSLFYLGGDGQEAVPDPAHPEALIPLVQPLQVGVANGQWPVANARVEFRVVAGMGLLEGGQEKQTLKTTDSKGVATCTWSLDPTQAKHQVEAVLLNDAGQPVHLPARFGASLSRTTGPTHEPGIHVDRMAWRTGPPLENDGEYKIAVISGGLQIFCDKEIYPAAVKGKPICFVTVDVPYPLTEADRGFWTRRDIVGLVGFQPITLAAQTAAEARTIHWIPDSIAVNWLQSVLKVMTDGGLGTRVLARLTLKGNFIWAPVTPAQPELYYLDGEVFGAAIGDRTRARLPSGDRRRGGDLEIWFWLVA